jgi:hypothetical protein
VTTPNSSVAITAGTGTTIATHTLGGKEVQAFVQVGPSGHIVDSLETWYAFADNVAFAQNKHMFSMFNASGSGKTVKVRKLFLIDLALAAVTGVAVRADVKRITAQTVGTGTVVTPTAADSANAALPGQIVCATATQTITEGPLLFPITFANDEVGATQGFPSNLIMQATNWMPEGERVQELACRVGEGFTLKCITSTVVGSLGVLVVFTVE